MSILQTALAHRPACSARPCWLRLTLGDVAVAGHFGASRRVGNANASLFPSPAWSTEDLYNLGRTGVHLCRTCGDVNRPKTAGRSTYPEVLTRILAKSARQAWRGREHKMVVMGRYFDNRAPVFRYMALPAHRDMYESNIPETPPQKKTQGPRHHF